MGHHRQAQEERSKQRAGAGRRHASGIPAASSRAALAIFVVVVTFILNLRFPLNRRLVAALSALLKLQVQLPDHIPIWNGNQLNGSSGKDCSASLWPEMSPPLVPVCHTA